MIYVDTSGWYALTVTSDIKHQVAKHWFSNNREQLLTTDYVFDETLTLLRARGHKQNALKWGMELLTDSFDTTLHTVSETEFMAAWDTFRNYSDKEWSFTDCISLVVMQRLGITTAFAFDHHFRQFGSINVVP